MKHAVISRAHVAGAGTAIFALVLIFATGCKTQPAARTDQQVSADIQAKINGEGALTGQNIQVSVANGVATLSGTVSDEASRALAGNDSGTVASVKTVVNNLTVQPAQNAVAPSPQPAQPEPSAQKPAREKQPEKRPRYQHHEDRPQVAQAITAPEPVEQAAESAPPPPPPPQAPPPAPPKPVVKEVTLPEGNSHSHPHYGDARQQDGADE